MMDQRPSGGQEKNGAKQRLLLTRGLTTQPAGWGKEERMVDVWPDIEIAQVVLVFLPFRRS